MMTAGMGQDACHVKSTISGVVVYFAGEDSDTLLMVQPFLVGKFSNL